MDTHLSPNAKLKPIGHSLFSGRDKSLINNKTLFTLNYWPISYFPYVSLISDMKGCDRQILGFRIIDQFWSRLDFKEVRSQVKYIHRILSLTFSFPIRSEGTNTRIYTIQDLTMNQVHRLIFSSNIVYLDKKLYEAYM